MAQFLSFLDIIYVVSPEFSLPANSTPPFEWKPQDYGRGKSRVTAILFSYNGVRSHVVIVPICKDPEVISHPIAVGDVDVKAAISHLQLGNRDNIPELIARECSGYIDLSRPVIVPSADIYRHAIPDVRVDERSFWDCWSFVFARPVYGDTQYGNYLPTTGFENPVRLMHQFRAKTARAVRDDEALYLKHEQEVRQQHGSVGRATQTDDIPPGFKKDSFNRITSADGLRSATERVGVQRSSNGDGKTGKDVSSKAVSSPSEDHDVSENQTRSILSEGLRRCSKMANSVLQMTPLNPFSSNFDDTTGDIESNRMVKVAKFHHALIHKGEAKPTVKDKENEKKLHVKSINTEKIVQDNNEDSHDQNDSKCFTSDQDGEIQAQPERRAPISTFSNRTRRFKLTTATLSSSPDLESPTEVFSQVLHRHSSRPREINIKSTKSTSYRRPSNLDSPPIDTVAMPLHRPRLREEADGHISRTSAIPISRARHKVLRETPGEESYDTFSSTESSKSCAGTLAMRYKSRPPGLASPKIFEQKYYLSSDQDDSKKSVSEDSVSLDASGDEYDEIKGKLTMTTDVEYRLLADLEDSDSDDDVETVLGFGLDLDSQKNPSSEQSLDQYQSTDEDMELEMDWDTYDGIFPRKIPSTNE